LKTTDCYYIVLFKYEDGAFTGHRVRAQSRMEALIKAFNRPTCDEREFVDVRVNLHYRACW